MNLHRLTARETNPNDFVDLVFEIARERAQQAMDQQPNAELVSVWVRDDVAGYLGIARFRRTDGGYAEFLGYEGTL